MKKPVHLRTFKDYDFLTLLAGNKNVLGWVVKILLLIVFLYVAWFAFNGQTQLSLSQSDWAAFGDYVGGTAGPIVALAALYFLSKIFVLQKEELDATRTALEATATSQQLQARLQYIQVQIQGHEHALKNHQLYLELANVQLRQVAEGFIPKGMMGDPAGDCNDLPMQQRMDHLNNYTIECISEIENELKKIAQYTDDAQQLIVRNTITERES